MKVKGGIFNPGARAQKAFMVLAIGGTLLVRCGFQVLSHADDVADVAGLAGDLGDLGDSDDPTDLDLPDVSVESPVFVAPDGSFSVVFPAVAQIAQDTTESSDGTTELTLHQGDWHVRQIQLPAGADPGPEVELPALVDEMSTLLSATVAGTEPLEVSGLPAQEAHLDFGGRQADLVVAGADGVYYELWHTPTGPEPADVSPLLLGFTA